MADEQQPGSVMHSLTRPKGVLLAVPVILGAAMLLTMAGGGERSVARDAGAATGGKAPASETASDRGAGVLKNEAAGSSSVSADCSTPPTSTSSSRCPPHCSPSHQGRLWQHWAMGRRKVRSRSARLLRRSNTSPATTITTSSVPTRKIRRNMPSAASAGP